MSLGCNPSLPANSSPGLSQPVHCIRLKGRQDGPERGEVLQPTTVLQMKQFEFRGFTLFQMKYFHSQSLMLMMLLLIRKINEALMKCFYNTLT